MSLSLSWWPGFRAAPGSDRSNSAQVTNCSVHPSIRPSTHPSVHLPIRPSVIRPSVHPFRPALINVHPAGADQRPPAPAGIDPQFVEDLAGVLENDHFGNGVTKGDNWCLQHPNRGDKAVRCRCDEIAFSI